MTQQIDPFINANWGWSDGEDGWGTGMNDNLLTYAFFHNRRLDGIIATPSSLPDPATTGQAFFSVSDKVIYFRVELEWKTVQPPVGMRFILKTDETEYKYNGTTLVLDLKSISDVSGLQAALDNKLDDSDVGVINGVAPLGPDNKVPAEYLPESGSYLGTWDASTNTPTIVSSSGVSGQFYIVTTAGSTTIDGNSAWSLGDQIRFNGTVWQRIPNADAVSSVNSQTGVVVLTATDVGATPASHIGSGGSQHANATTSVSGFLSSSDKLKLDGVASGATANSTDAQLRDRATHTGTQAQSTVVNLVSDLAAKQATLVSGTNIKTINGTSILGSGDITISGGGSSSFTGLTDTPNSYIGFAGSAPIVKVDESGLEFIELGTAAFSNSSDFANSSHTHANATTSLAGFLSASDKIKLDGLGTMSTQNAVSVAITGGTINGTTIGATVRAAANFNVVDVDGNFTLTGSSRRIISDFTSSPSTARTLFKTNVTNGATRVEVIPDGTGTTSNLGAYNNSDPTNAAGVRLTATSTDTRVESIINGSGSYLPLHFSTGGASRANISTSGTFTITTPNNNPLVLDTTASTGEIQTKLSGTTVGYYKWDASGATILSADGTKSIQVTNVATNVVGVLNASGAIKSGNFVEASGAGGFLSSTFVTNARNPIWRFGNADGYGLSYFIGASGYGGTDSIGFHFGTATSAGSSVHITSTGLYATSFVGNGNNLTSLNASNINSGTLSAARLPFTYSTADTGSTLVQRQSNGYINVSYINTNIAQVNSGIITDFYVGFSNDGYIYKCSPSYALAALGAVSKSTPSQTFQNIGTVSGAVSITAASGIHVLATVNGNTTWTFPSPSSTEVHALTLELTNGGAHTMTWPSSTRWSGGVPPSLTASGTDILVFTKAGTNNWRGYLSSKDSK